MSRRRLLKIKDNPFTSGIFPGGSELIRGNIDPATHYDDVLKLYDSRDRKYVFGQNNAMVTDKFGFIQIVPASHNLYGDGKGCYMYCMWHDSSDINEAAYLQTGIDTGLALGLTTSKSPTPVYAGYGNSNDGSAYIYLNENKDINGNGGGSGGYTYLDTYSNKDYQIYIPTFKNDWSGSRLLNYVNAIPGLAYPLITSTSTVIKAAAPPFCGDYFHRNPATSTNTYNLLNSRTTVTSQAATTSNTPQLHNPQRLIKQYFGSQSRIGDLLYQPSIAELIYLAAQINPINELLNRLNWYKLCLDNNVDYILNEQDYSKLYWLNYYYLNFSCFGTQGGGIEGSGTYYATNNIKTYPYILSSTRAYVTNGMGDYYWALDISNLDQPKVVMVPSTQRGLLVAFARF